MTPSELHELLPDLRRPLLLSRRRPCCRSAAAPGPGSHRDGSRRRLKRLIRFLLTRTIGTDRGPPLRIVWPHQQSRPSETARGGRDGSRFYRPRSGRRRWRHRIAGLAPTALAQDKEVQLKLAHWVPPAHPLQPALQAWAADIEKASNGSIKSAIFPPSSSQRRSTTTTWRAMGSPISPGLIPATSPGASPIIAAGELPFPDRRRQGRLGGGRRLVIANTPPPR